MIVPIVAFIAAFLFSVFFIFKETKTEIITLLISFVFALAIMFISDLVGISISNAPYKVVDKEVENIYTFNQTIGQTGSFFLGSGRLQDKVYYFYAVKSKYGLKIKRIDIDKDVRIKFVKNNFRLEKLILKKDSIWIFDTRTIYIFYIPKNSFKLLKMP